MHLWGYTHSTALSNVGYIIGVDSVITAALNDAFLLIQILKDTLIVMKLGFVLCSINYALIRGNNKIN